jgi:hypothetical protein
VTVIGKELRKYYRFETEVILNNLGVRCNRMHKLSILLLIEFRI